MTQESKQGDGDRESGFTEIRLLWQDGPFQLECVGRTGAMHVSVFEGGVLLAEEQVTSAESAYRRGRELCASLSQDRRRQYGKDSA